MVWCGCVLTIGVGCVYKARKFNYYFYYITGATAKLKVITFCSPHQDTVCQLLYTPHKVSRAAVGAGM